MVISTINIPPMLAYIYIYQHHGSHGYCLIISHFATHNFERWSSFTASKLENVGQKKTATAINGSIMRMWLCWAKIMGARGLLGNLTQPNPIMVDSTTTNPHHCRWLNTPPSGAVSENVSLRRFSGPLVSYPSADSGHGLLQHHLEKVWKSGNTAETN